MIQKLRSNISGSAQYSLPTQQHNGFSLFKRHLPSEWICPSPVIYIGPNLMVLCDIFMYFFFQLRVILNTAFAFTSIVFNLTDPCNKRWYYRGTSTSFCGQNRCFFILCCYFKVIFECFVTLYLSEVWLSYYWTMADIILRIFLIIKFRYLCN